MTTEAVVSQLRVPVSVRDSAAAHGGGVVLDLRAGRWYALNATAQRMWDELCRTGNLDDAVRAVAAAYPPEWEQRIRADGERLVAELADRRLVVVGNADGRTPATEDEREAAGTPCVFAADPTVRAAPCARAHLALLMSLLLLRLPFRWTTRLVALARRRRCRPDPTTAEVAGILVALGRAARRWPGRVACLESSLGAVLTAILCRWRLDWVIGVADDPARFHSWVEVHGVAIVPEPEPDFPDFRRVLVL